MKGARRRGKQENANARVCWSLAGRTGSEVGLVAFEEKPFINSYWLGGVAGGGWVVLAKEGRRVFSAVGWGVRCLLGRAQAGENERFDLLAVDGKNKDWPAASSRTPAKGTANKGWLVM